MKSIKPKDTRRAASARAASASEADFHQPEAIERCASSTTNPPRPALPQGEGQGDQLFFMEHGLMENHHGLLVDALPDAGRQTSRAGRRTAYDRPHADQPQAISH